MGRQKFKIAQFVPILPFGYTSRQALCIAGTNNPTAWTEYDPDTPMSDGELICNRQWQYANAHIKTMIEQGLIEEVERKYGKHHWEIFQQIRFTQYGYNLISGNCDYENEHERVSVCVDSGMGYRMAAEYLPTDIFDTHILLQMTKEQVGIDHPHFTKNLMRAIANDDATLMAYNEQPATTLNFNSHIYNGHQQYRSWRISNINALFRANGFLTNIDRRPITLADTENAEPEGEDDGQGTAFYHHCKDALTRWYEVAEDSFLFSYPWAKIQDGLAFGSNVLPWEQIPAFYSAHEFPGFASPPLQKDPGKKISVANIVRYNLTGIAIGLKHNYLVYHTRPKHTPLSEKIEENSCLTVQQNLDLLNEESPIFGANREVRNAIIVCPSVKQFRTLFTTINKKMGHKSTMNPTNGVFDTMCIVLEKQVPRNNSLFYRAVLDFRLFHLRMCYTDL